MLRDPAEQAVSAHFAHQTGIWHLPGADPRETVHATVPYNAAELLDAYRGFCDDDAFVRELAGRLSPFLTVEYHDLDADPLSTVARAAEFLERRPLQRDAST